ncbi:ATP-dependent nuclease [Lentilactobacillus hilgardii]|uniref:ATP-dependent nuclease n=5 Tax=Lentilactobacillus hilgardii TaxID=1588 RepID=UPI0039EACBC6
MESISDLDNHTNELVKKVKEKFIRNEKIYEPYIQSIRFPKYKSLEENTKIDLDFPVVALIGENGCNKTSVLQALYGAPQNQSVGDYWFETDVDKIDDFGKKNCFIYDYIQPKLGKKVETLKTRVKKPNNPDYWEPSRPIKAYGMDTLSKAELLKYGNKATTRWDQINKNVVYCDCKEYVSAYDLFFYHFNFKISKRYRSKQDFIRSRSKHLSHVIESGSTIYNLWDKNQIQSNEKLSNEVCNVVSQVMDEDYSEIRIVTHTLYSNGTINKPAKTIWMKKNDMSYSEAFAGTGESRVILIVNDILNAPKNSLLLIDEPEISLHPKAIINLKNFLIKQALVNNQQIIITTHSPQMIKGLPSKAIKYMSETSNEKINVSNITDYEEAFFQLQDKIEKPIKIFVEDKLTQAIVQRVLRDKFEKFMQQKVSVQIIPGGAKNIINHFISASAITNNDSEFYLLDGDQFIKQADEENSELLNFNEHRFCNENLSESQNKSSFLSRLICKLTGITDKNLAPSIIRPNKVQDEKVQKCNELKFLNFWMTNVRFLDYSTPEIGLIVKGSLKM